MKRLRWLPLAIVPWLSGACVASSALESTDGNGEGEDALVATISGCDVLVVGASTGGVAAAHEAASLGANVCLTEETDWLGGQFTSQGVPLDTGDHDYSLTMSAYLDAVRASYHQSYPAWPAGRDNPGECGREVCFEPSVGESVLESSVLAPLVGSGKLRVFRQYRPISVTKSGSTVTGANFTTAQGQVYAAAKITIDATEFGDLFPANMDGGPGANVAYRVGRDGPHTYSPAERDAQYQWNAQRTPWPAGDNGDSECTQRLTWVFDMQYLASDVNPGDSGVPASAPPGYDPAHYCSTWPTRCEVDLEFDTSGQSDVAPPNNERGSWWNWRRVKGGRRLVGDLSTALAPTDSGDPAYQDITSVNYFGANDFASNEAWCGPYGCDPAEQGYSIRQAILGYARNFSLGYFWYLRNDAKRPDGGVGYHNLRTRPSVQGGDYVTKFPYVRESKRLVGLTTITEEDILLNTQGTVEHSRLGRRYDDTLGGGEYQIDVKGCAPTDTTPVGEMTPPSFGGDNGGRLAEIPLGALIPEAVDGLLAGGKNLSVSHIANGEYRIHPIEWNVGQAAGATAAMAVLLVPNQIVQPRTIRTTPRYLRLLQQQLVRGRGSKIVWAGDVSDQNRADPTYVAVMMLAGARVMETYVGVRDCHGSLGCDLDDGLFRPAQALTRGEGADLVAKEVGIAPAPCEAPTRFTDVPCSHPFYPSIEALADLGLVGGYPDHTYRPDAPNTMTRAELAKVLVNADCYVNPSACAGTPANSGYGDVLTTDWFYPFVARAKARGFLAGETTGTTFSPNNAVTRGSAAQWAYNQMRWKYALP
jgi:hypothetical protein